MRIDIGVVVLKGDAEAYPGGPEVEAVSEGQVMNRDERSTFLVGYERHRMAFERLLDFLNCSSNRRLETSVKSYHQGPPHGSAGEDEA